MSDTEVLVPPLPIDRRPRPGAPAPLFDRLVDARPAEHPHREPAERRPKRVLDVEGLRESVLAELGRLLSTRLPIDQVELAETGRVGPTGAALGRTVIDYGIPDFGTFTATDATARARMAGHIAAAIRAFEPRLADPRVTIERDPDPRRPHWRAMVSGMLVSGDIREPFNVPLALEIAEAAGGGEDGP
ncbi:type VI secretion system baseplate subunit TssE [Novispirillum sp. DQ9]|uniref:type VI secretion system baseplate subunit TssE n=1 Tax=Novispirillum sp. DQ9 TaxID=3398612 RepID=UPI003C7A03AC